MPDAGSEGRIHGTHAVELAADRGTKRFRDGAAEAGGREWRALELLAGHAPGLAPAPLAAEFSAGAPVITMSRLPGEPMRGRVLDAPALDALADAVTQLHAALPPGVLAEVPPRPGPAGTAAHVRAQASRVRIPPGGEVDAAVQSGLHWLDRSGFGGPATAARRQGSGAHEVFGAGDGNLANYLWDGTRVRIVDFEDSGRSDLAFELAEITEHVGSWVETRLDVPGFLARFPLTPADRARLRDCRRLLALVWLFILASDAERTHPRNPPGTAEQQARRLTALLS